MWRFHVDPGESRGWGGGVAGPLGHISPCPGGLSLSGPAETVVTFLPSSFPSRSPLASTQLAASRCGRGERYGATWQRSMPCTGGQTPGAEGRGKNRSRARWGGELGWRASEARRMEESSLTQSWALQQRPLCLAVLWGAEQRKPFQRRLHARHEQGVLFPTEQPQSP